MSSETKDKTLSLIIFNSPRKENLYGPSLGFASIVKLRDETRQMCEKNKKVFRDTRGWDDIVFEIEDLNEEITELIRKDLPDNVEIPVFVDSIPRTTGIQVSKCMIISKKGTVICNPDDARFKILTANAFVGLDIVRSKYELSLVEVNSLCRDFAIQEHIKTLIPDYLDLEQLRDHINIGKEYEAKLSGILVDIKTIFLALEYDFYQLAARVSRGSEAGARLRRYIYVTDSIYRIGALWERLAGLAVILERPEVFDDVFSAKKIRKKFIGDFKDAKNPVAAKIWDFAH